MSEEVSSQSSDSERNSDNNFVEIPNVETVQETNVNVENNINDFDNNLPETVCLIKCPNGAKVYLVGTAHFSKESQDDVSKVIQTVKPDIVVVELCVSRINILQLDENTLLEEAKNINFDKVRNVIKQNGFFNGLTYILLINMSAHLTKELGMAPGGEFRRAFQEVHKIPNCEMRLGDRPIEITINRALASLSWFQSIKVGWNLLTSKDPVSKEDIEKCKQRDMLEELLAEMVGEYPGLGEVFLKERDIFLTHSLQAAAVPIMQNGVVRSPKVVGVVGIGHVPGILKLWNEPQAPYIVNLMRIPPKTMCSKILRISFKISLISFGGYIFYKYVPGVKNVPVYCNTVINNVITYFKS